MYFPTLLSAIMVMCLYKLQIQIDQLLYGLLQREKMRTQTLSL